MDRTHASFSGPIEKGFITKFFDPIRKEIAHILGSDLAKTLQLDLLKRDKATSIIRLLSIVKIVSLFEVARVSHERLKEFFKSSTNRYQGSTMAQVLVVDPNYVVDAALRFMHVGGYPSEE